MISSVTGLGDSLPLFIDRSLSIMLDSSPVSSIDIFLHGVSYAVDKAADRLAQLVEHQTTVRAVVGSNPGRTNTQGL